MSVASVVTRGFGASIATIALVTTAGYSISVASALPDSIIGATLSFLNDRTTESYLNSRTTLSYLNDRTTEDA